VHPGELLKECGKELRIMGGVDKMELAKGKKAIKAYLETLVPLVERGGYIPFWTTAARPTSTPRTTSTTRPEGKRCSARSDAYASSPLSLHGGRGSG